MCAPPRGIALLLPNLPMVESNPPRVAVIGEALIDRFPDADVIGGAPFNVARNLALLGAAPLMNTRVGNDALGDTILADFARFGMDPRGLQRDSAHATGTVTVLMSGTQHRFEIGADSARDHLDAAAAVRVVCECAPAVAYFGTLAQRGAVSRDAIRAALSASDALPFLDLNLRDGPDNRALAEDALNLERLVKVNDDELEQLAAWFMPPGGWALRASVEALLQRFDLQRLTVTRGAEGWSCLDAHQGWLEGPATPTTVRDTVGAGDAFAAVLLLGELGGCSLRTTLQRASAHASAVCGISGAVDEASSMYAHARAAWALDEPTSP